MEELWEKEETGKEILIRQQNTLIRIFGADQLDEDQILFIRQVLKLQKI